MGRSSLRHSPVRSYSAEPPSYSLFGPASTARLVPQPIVIAWAVASGDISCGASFDGGVPRADGASCSRCLRAEQQIQQRALHKLLDYVYMKFNLNRWLQSVTCACCFQAGSRRIGGPMPQPVTAAAPTTAATTAAAICTAAATTLTRAAWPPSAHAGRAAHPAV